MTNAAIPWWKEPTRQQWTSFGAAWAGWVLDAFDFCVFLLVMPQIAAEFQVPITATAGSITLTLLLRLLGGTIAGAAADKWGRKLPLMLSILGFAACDGLIAFAPSFAWVLVCRTIFGFAMGAEWASGATLAMENWPQRSRGIASGMLQGSWAIGYFFAAGAAAIVVPMFGWRGLFVVAALPALLIIPIRAWVPESPEWRRETSPAERARRRARASFGALRDALPNLAWGSLIMALGFSAYYGLTALYPTFVQKELAVSVSGMARFIQLFNVGMLLGAVVCGMFAARRSIRAAIVVPALLSLAVLPLYVSHHLGLALGGALLMGVVGAGYCGVTPLLLTSLFPAEIRGRSVGLVYHVGACVGALMPLVVAGLPSRVGLSLGSAIAIVTGSAQLLLAIAVGVRGVGVRRQASPEQAVGVAAMEQAT